MNTLNYIHEAKVRSVKNQLYSANTPNYVREQMFAQLSTGFKHDPQMLQDWKF